MGITTFRKLTAVCLVSSTVPSAAALTAAIDAAHAIGLLSRESNSCSGSNYLPCNLPGLPSTFCCPSDTVCTQFNNAASVVCCPSGQDCKTIAPIICDITQQNAALHPLNQLHSTDLKGTLQECGNACCPNGFTCQNSQCIMKGDVTSSSITKAPKPTTISTKASSTNQPKSSSSASSTPSNTASQQSSVPTTITKARCDKFPAIAIIAGFLPGLLLGIILSVLVVLCLGRRRRAASRKSSEFGSQAATVSEPMSHPGNNAFRTDFLRRESGSKQRVSRVKSLFSRSSSIRTRDGIGRSLKDPVRTPDMRREPSMESIKIYSPPNGGLGRPGTTFTDMMVDAGFKPGEPYLYTTPPPVRRG